MNAAVAHFAVRLDSYGLRECLEGSAFRLYRLPESDFFGWERIAAQLPWFERASRPSRPQRNRAGIVTGRARGWQNVNRLSALGWDVCKEILRAESAELCSAVWRD
jgi:hypothetical protein